MSVSNTIRSGRLLVCGLLFVAMAAQAQAPNIPALVKTALGDGIVPYAGVKPVVADFTGDGKPDLAVVADFNKKLATWLKRGTVILNLDSPSLAPMRPDNEQHFCFGLLVLDNMQPDQKTIFYGCFTGWHLVPASKPGSGAALDLDMDSGSTTRLYYDGSRYRTRVVHRN
jgi:hypothetical protein